MINAQSFVPQSRPRVFIVGVHEDVRSPLVFKKPSSPSFGDPWYQAVDRAAALRPAALRQLMEEIELPTAWVATPIRPPVQRKYDLASLIDVDESQAWWGEEALKHHYEMMNDGHRAVVDRCLRERGHLLGTGYRRKREGRVRLEVRFDGIAGCLRTPSGGSGRQIVVLVDAGVLKMRWMTSSEYGRLQGANGFNLVGTERQRLFGFGDAVCVPVIEWIDKCVLTPIFDSQVQHPE